jgi:predicted CXXCH cytochrome family protein
MRKLKFSFAFVLMLFLVGMYSAVAFAAGSTVPGYNSQVTTEGNVINTVGEGGLASDDATNDNNYDQHVKGNANQSGLGVGGQTANFDQVIKSDNMVKGTDGTHGTQRTHGEYMNNTNSCASCHQTHTGAGASLLFKNGEYQTCTACHDGTLGFYNVFTGSDSAGTFGGTHDGNMSVHLANGTVGVKAAPGGKNDGGGEWDAEFTCASCHAPHGSFSDRLLNSNPNHMGNTLADEGGKRLEGVPVVATLDLNTKDVSGDKSFTLANGDTKVINYVLHKEVIGATVDATYTKVGLTTGDTVLQLYKWDVDAGAKDAEGHALGAYVKDTDPWLHGYDFDAAHVKHYWTVFQNGSNADKLTTDMLKVGVVYGEGFIGTKADNATQLATIDTIVKGNISRGYEVKLAIDDATINAANNTWATRVSALWNSKDAKYIKNAGVTMSGFCAACHTDYLAKSGTQTGTFDHAYRHTTTSDSYTCVRCHYAHGTDVTIMRDARGLTYTQIFNDDVNYFSAVPKTDVAARETIVKDYLIDKNPSSVLKRYTNMAVCWACHTSSHSEGTRNSGSYQYNATPGVDTDRNGIDTDY